MTDHSTLMMLAVMAVTFIAGYSIISYAVRKFREGAARPETEDQDQKGSSPTTDDTSVQKSETSDVYRRRQEEDE